MEEHVYTTGNYRITIRASKSEHESRRERGRHQREDARTHHRQPHQGSNSQNPASGEHARDQGHLKLTAENLAAHQRQESSSRAPQVHREQEDDTAAQCGQRYPEERRRRRQHFDDIAHAQHNRHTRHAAHHRHRQESGPYETVYSRATEGERSGSEYVNQLYAQPRYQGGECRRQHTYDPEYHQPDRQELGQERFRHSYSYREESSPRRRRASSSQARDVPEWVLCKKGLRNVEERSEEGSVQCEIEEAE